jgi:predicted nucleotidyltransferase
MTIDEALRRIAAHTTELTRFKVKSLAIFGSVARGEASADSDVDLLVEFLEPVGLFEFVRLKRFLESVFDRPVDLVTPDALKRQLRDRILREAVRAA